MIYKNRNDENFLLQLFGESAARNIFKKSYSHIVEPENVLCCALGRGPSKKIFNWKYDRRNDKEMVIFKTFVFLFIIMEDCRSWFSPVKSIQNCSRRDNRVLSLICFNGFNFVNLGN